jgi:hypothetical protein
MSIVITHEALQQLRSSDNLKIMKRTQKASDSYNYYLAPKLILHLYQAKVVFVNTSYIVFQYSKFESLGLLTLLRHSGEVLKKKIEYNYDLPSSKQFFGIAQETEETFRVRCSLPKKNDSFDIKVIDNHTNQPIPFRLPKAKSVLHSVSIQIKNVWETHEKVGFNLEVVEVRD